MSSSRTLPDGARLAATPTGSDVGAPPRRRRPSPRPRYAPYLFLSPFFILFALFWVYPVLRAILLSFQRWTAASSSWVGLANYRYVLEQPQIRRAFENLAWYAVVNNVVQITIALAIALLLDQQVFRRLAGLYRVAFFLPNIVSGVSTALLFGIILGVGGVADRVLSSIGVHISWLQSATWSKPAVVIAGGWRWIGYWIVILSAALQGVPREFYESAAIDGVGRVRQAWYVSIPMIRPVLLFVITTNTIGTMQIFEEPFLMLTPPGGALGSGTTPVVEIYRLGFINFDLGSAAALGWLLTILIVAVTVAQLTIARRREWLE